MATIVFLKELFSTHLIDLKDNQGDTEDTIPCPICLTKHSEESTENRKLTDGHIWPLYIREITNTNITREQRVLLCQNCNSKTGGAGDAQMQEVEKIKEGEKTGDLHGIRRMRFLPHSKPDVIPEVRGKIKIDDNETTKSKLIFPQNKNSKSWMTSPENERKIKELIRNQEKMGLLVDPPQHVNEKLAKIGWLTSAYLFAFYALGYRYILDKTLDPIREAILNSFTNHEIDLPSCVEFITCNDHFHKEPQISLVIPRNSRKQISLRIDILNYHTHLPVTYDQELLETLLNEIGINIQEEMERSKLNPRDDYFYLPIRHFKAEKQNSIWDYILGKPLG